MAWDDLFYDYPAAGYLITAARLNAIVTQIKTYLTGTAGIVDKAIPRASGTTGLILQGSAVTIDDSGSVNIPAGQHYQIGGAGIPITDLAPGTALYYPRINSAGTAFEFAPGSAGSGDVTNDVIWDAAGDIAVGTGANHAVRLPVGASPHMTLVPDTTASGGLRWSNVLPPLAGYDLSTITTTKDNGGVERTFFKDDCSNDLRGAYTQTGTVDWVAGYYTLQSGEAITTVLAYEYAKKVDTVINMDNIGGICRAYCQAHYIDDNNRIVTYVGDTNIIVTRTVAGVATNIINVAHGMSADTDYTISTDITATSVTVYKNGVQLATAAEAQNAAFLVNGYVRVSALNTTVLLKGITINTGTVAYSDPCTADLTARLATITGTAPAFNTDHYDLVANTDSKYRIKSYQHESGSRIFKFKLPASGTDGDYINMRFVSTSDFTKGFGVGAIRVSGAWNVYTVLDTTGTNGAAISALADGDYLNVEVEYDAPHGQFWYYLYETTKPTAPTGTGFGTYDFGCGGVVCHSASGSKTFGLYGFTIRANNIMSRTNVSATEAGFYFIPSGTGQFAQTGTWTFAGTTLSCSGAGNATLPFQTTIGVHKYTPTLANGTDYYYFGGYRVTFVASGGNTCTVTLETAAGAAQGTGSLVVATTAGLFGAPVIITETASAITVTVAGATGTIVSGTTTSTNSAPKFTVGTANCTFADYSFAGTRYCLAPQPRGAMLNTALWAFDYDCIAEFTGVSASSVDTANGRLTLADTTDIYPSGLTPAAAVYYADILRSGASGSITFTVAGNTINITYAGAVSINGGAAEAWSVDTPSALTRLWFVASGTQIAVYSNSVLKGTKTGLTLTASNFKMKRTTTNWYVYLLGYTDSVNKFVTITSPVQGGRFDVQEEAYWTIANPFKHGSQNITITAQTTDGANDDTEVAYSNITDSTSIDTDGSTTEADLTLTTTNPTDLIIDTLTQYRDRGDNLHVGVRRKTYGVANDNQPAVFVSDLNFVPVWGD